MIDLEKTIISQYANSPTITQLIRNMNTYLDPRTDFQKFLSYVWDVDTAQEFGLDILGKIVGIGRYLEVPEIPVYFGFDEGSGYYPFDEAPFYNGNDATNTFRLEDEPYRKLILVKALANISTSTSRSINQLLQNLFYGRGRCYVNDLGGMAMQYTFEFALEPYELATLSQSGALPRPAGVFAYIFQIPVNDVFGFAEMDIGVTGFDYGVFLHEGALTNAN